MKTAREKNRETNQTRRTSSWRENKTRRVVYQHLPVAEGTSFVTPDVSGVTKYIPSLLLVWPECKQYRRSFQCFGFRRRLADSTHLFWVDLIRESLLPPAALYVTMHATSAFYSLLLFAQEVSISSAIDGLILSYWQFMFTVWTYCQTLLTKIISKCLKHRCACSCI